MKRDPYFQVLQKWRQVFEGYEGKLFARIVIFLDEIF